MKKYKLIDKYPFGPKTIGLEIKQNGDYWQSNFCLKNVEHFHKSDKDFNPADYPKNWEEVIENTFTDIGKDENGNIIANCNNCGCNGVLKDSHACKKGVKKDYEILSLISNAKSKRLWYWSSDSGNTGDGFYTRADATYTNQEKWLDACANFWDIYSVKRLSDSEIFTVGDVLNFNGRDIGKLIRIDFEKAPVDKNTGKLCFVNDNIFLGSWWDINQLSKVKKPLATTEKVVQKDYEILSFVRNNESKYKGIKFNLSSQGTYGPDFIESNLTLEHCLSGGFDIHSVKRLTDNEVFTIGDLIARNKTWEHSTPCYITSFIIKDGILTYNIKQGEFFGNYPFDDETYKYKLKAPLFTTEDGVDIFEGDKFERVRCIDYKLLNQHTWVSSDIVKYFSTVKAAEEYILLNKPCLSINDFKELDNFNSKYWDDCLKEKVRSKINNK